MPQSDSNARSSPECGVAVSRTTVRARRARAPAASSAIGAPGKSMGLVEDHRVPHEPLERSHHLRTLDEVDRCDRHRAPRPGVGRTPRRTGARNRARVGMPRIETEALRAAPPATAQ